MIGTGTTYIILLLFLIWYIYLIWEKRRSEADRALIPHIIHVNGIRGKSSVCRLIDAGLRAGGMRCFCKTTGTDPMYIDVENRELPIHRRGRSNIKEQIRFLNMAAGQKAEALVVECMAVNPALQWACQEEILKADIGVITNIRRDHTDLMGEELSDICDCLSATIPTAGALFSAEDKPDMQERLRDNAGAKGTKAVFTPVIDNEADTQALETYEAIDFPENVALALEVCKYLGVSKEQALKGMSSYKKDPYRLSVKAFDKGVFINGLSINDVDSIKRIWDMVREGKIKTAPFENLILIINNRPDRGARTLDMIRAALYIGPDEIWLFGASRPYVKYRLGKGFPRENIKSFKSAALAHRASIKENSLVFAIGNIAGEGRKLSSLFE